jgi:hypothetical protein
LFVHLPEIEFPKSFNWKIAAGMAGRIRGAPRRAMVEKSLNSLRLRGRVGPG